VRHGLEGEFPRVLDRGFRRRLISACWGVGIWGLGLCSFAPLCLSLAPTLLSIIPLSGAHSSFTFFRTLHIVGARATARVNARRGVTQQQRERCRARDARSESFNQMFERKRRQFSRNMFLFSSHTEPCLTVLHTHSEEESLISPFPVSPICLGDTTTAGPTS
jgi:hypothetical protein